MLPRTSTASIRQILICRDTGTFSRSTYIKIWYPLFVARSSNYTLAHEIETRFSHSQSIIYSIYIYIYIPLHSAESITRDNFPHFLNFLQIRNDFTQKLTYKTFIYYICNILRINSHTYHSYTLKRLGIYSRYSKKIEQINKYCRRSSYRSKWCPNDHISNAKRYIYISSI